MSSPENASASGQPSANGYPRKNFNNNSNTYDKSQPFFKNRFSADNGGAPRFASKMPKPRVGPVLTLNASDWEGYFDEKDKILQEATVGSNQNSAPHDLNQCIKRSSEISNNVATKEGPRGILKNSDKPTYETNNLNPAWGETALPKPINNNVAPKLSQAGYFPPSNEGAKPTKNFNPKNFGNPQQKAPPQNMASGVAPQNYNVIYPPVSGDGLNPNWD